ncbi:chromate transporter [Paenibacillus xylanivorans]|uniref:Chromate transporter n=1 Tax=Paenibacillus xylanivorans TaxID=1705561 RepID=A0A0M9BND8_9BACL|nr:chromate transporter [Paenibacillus xylanivorans]KOY14842.1 chromate transporter [Paenibacillus xylanivorans]
MPDGKDEGSIKNLKEQFMVLTQLFWIFFRIGPSTFGGGYAMLPIIEREVVNKKKWMQEDEIGELISLAGAAPGGVGVNAAAIIGHRQAGIAGAVSAVIGVTCPTFLIVILISVFAVLFRNQLKVEAALKGMNGGIIALISMAAYRTAKYSILDTTTAIAAIVTVAVLLFAGIHPLYLIVSGLICGMAVIRIKKRLGLQVKMEKESVTGSYPELEYYI